MSAALTLTFDDGQLSRLERAAAERQMSREELAQDILSAFLDGEDDAEFEDWQLEKVRAGQAAAASGDFASEAEVERLFSRYR